LIKTYFNEKADVWDKMFAEKDRTKLESTAKRMDIKNGSIVLDIGTGTGVLLPFIVERVGKGAVYALDVAEKMLRKSKDKEYGSYVNYVQADIMSAPFITGSFDTVICYSVFPHFSDKSKALKEIFRVLKQDGRLYIAHTSGREAINTIHSSIPGMKDHLLPDPIQMLELLNRSCFSNVEVEDKQENYFVKALKGTA